MIMQHPHTAYVPPQTLHATHCKHCMPHTANAAYHTLHRYLPQENPCPENLLLISIT
jgi:hypothetical protein